MPVFGNPPTPSHKDDVLIQAVQAALHQHTPEATQYPIAAIIRTRDGTYLLTEGEVTPMFKDMLSGIVHEINTCRADWSQAMQYTTIGRNAAVGENEISVEGVE